jgi:hypothetical protein
VFYAATGKIGGNHEKREKKGEEYLVKPPFLPEAEKDNQGKHNAEESKVCEQGKSPQDSHPEPGCRRFI